MANPRNLLERAALLDDQGLAIDLICAALAIPRDTQHTDKLPEACRWRGFSPLGRLASDLSLGAYAPAASEP